MDIAALAQKMDRLRAWQDGACADGALARIQHDDGAFGGAYVTIDPAKQDTAASANGNRIYLRGAEGGLSRDGFDQLAAEMRKRGVERYYVWLSPGPRIDEVRSWLADMKFTRGPWTRYPTLVLTDVPSAAQPTDLSVRKVSADEVRAMPPELGAMMRERFIACAGHPNFTHYMAFDRVRPIAVAVLALFEDVAYLTLAATNEADRRRGAQSGLIAARVAEARARGYGLIVSETLTMLTSSLGNLERAGFREVYEREVYGPAA